MTVPHNTSRQKRFTLPKGAQQTFSSVDSLPAEPSCSRGKSLTADEAHLQRGLTNPEYKGTQQDLTDEKERLQGYVGLREIKVSL